ncbi:hypothetical protein CY34DRAFT_269993 [Suillus luteus UH-Slu-Lm8-n1]|uniref:DUF6533 domain-containing protein n=1 Tax=Suillus luteus UH-Slu-Lm8-n1 TaxID=930992 RepID=A0A0D0AFA6_9AGAM|nr:hypothetical protein CY34DRAFT_269993 [Suillus luteus UH-Slu-Lm8-n1]
MDTIAAEAQEILFCTYAILAGNSILMYDHVATLPEEIAFIWRRPKALSGMLFLFNRYLALLANISSLVVAYAPLSDERFVSSWFLNITQQRYSCMRYTLFRQLSLIFQAIVVCLIMTIRTYALYGGSKRLLACLTIIMSALAIAVSVGSFGQFLGNAVLLPGIGCYETYAAATAARLGLAWLAEMVFELLIFILIVYRICKTKGLRLSLVTRGNIIDIIFHDGAMYFGAMALINTPNIITYYSGSVAVRGSLSTLTSCLSVTLMSRLMLNLHKSIDTGILSITTHDEGPSLAVLTTGINVQSAISSHP